MATKSKNKRGRPAFQWTEEIEREILGRITQGESVLSICGPDRDGWLPSEKTFYVRLLADDEFSQKYTRARVAQAHREFDEIRAIADMAQPDDVQVARLRIDARKWRASKLAPKIYGEKLELSGDPENPVVMPTMIRLAGPGDDSNA